jgi:hypothetical protein
VRLSPASSAILAAIVDGLLVTAFVLIGRASHSEGPLGTLVTLWPFLVGLAVGWIGARAWRTPFRIRWTGLTVWAATVIIGILLRVVSGQGVQIAFVIVATVVLALFLLGWRAIAILAARLRSRRA